MIISYVLSSIYYTAKKSRMYKLLYSLIDLISDRVVSRDFVKYQQYILIIGFPSFTTDSFRGFWLSVISKKTRAEIIFENFIARDFLLILTQYLSSSDFAWTVLNLLQITVENWWLCVKRSIQIEGEQRHLQLNSFRRISMTWIQFYLIDVVEWQTPFLV